MTEKRKPEIKSELVQVSYWSCGDSVHRHRSESAAAKCISAQDAAAQGGTGARRWSASDYALVLAQFRAGAKKAALARQLGVSGTRVRQVLATAERMERLASSSDPLDTLSVRTRNCLRAESLFSVDDVRAALDAGRLSKVPNLGSISQREVRLWLAALKPPNVRGKAPA